MSYLHTIPVNDLSKYPDWMRAVPPVRVDELKQGQRFHPFTSEGGEPVTLELGCAHAAPFVYHVKNVVTGEQSIIGACAAAWPLVD